MKTPLLILATALAAATAHAEFSVNRMFGHHMVLQTDHAIPVWGTADAGTKVSIKFNGQEKSGKADADGKWMIKLDPMKVSASDSAFTVTGPETHTFTNVVVGEVWLGSGQSNMAGSAGGYAKNDPVLTEIVNGGPYPALRLYDHRAGKWNIASAESIKRFSAIHVSFGFALQQALDQPVGLMYGAVGGTPSGRWLTEEMAEADPQFMAALKKTGVSSIEEFYKGSEEALAKHQQAVAAAKKAGKKPPRMRRQIRLGDLYKNHIAHFVPYAMRGVLWDQGESRTAIKDVDQFTTMHALITGWRTTWGQGDFPFLHVQKPSGGGIAWDPENPVNRGAKKIGNLPGSHNTKPASLEYPLNHVRMATIKHAPIVTAVDLQPGVHPQNKSGYGKRASVVALGVAYGRDVAICGPVYKSHQTEGATLRVQFDHIGKGLAFKHAEKLQGFEIAGADGQWQWAEAKIDGDSVVLSHPEVNKPTQVQYAFHKSPNFANLFNKDGLPALLFTTNAGTE